MAHRCWPLMASPRSALPSSCGSTVRESTRAAPAVRREFGRADRALVACGRRDARAGRERAHPPQAARSTRSSRRPSSATGRRGRPSRTCSSRSRPMSTSRSTSSSAGSTAPTRSGSAPAPSGWRATSSARATTPRRATARSTSCATRCAASTCTRRGSATSTSRPTRRAPAWLADHPRVQHRAQRGVLRATPRCCRPTTRRPSRAQLHHIPGPQRALPLLERRHVLRPPVCARHVLLAGRADQVHRGGPRASASATTTPSAAASRTPRGSTAACCRSASAGSPPGTSSTRRRRCARACCTSSSATFPEDFAATAASRVPRRRTTSPSPTRCTTTTRCSPGRAVQKIGAKVLYVDTTTRSGLRRMKAMLGKRQVRLLLPQRRQLPRGDARRARPRRCAPSSTPTTRSPRRGSAPTAAHELPRSSPPADRTPAPSTDGVRRLHADSGPDRPERCAFSGSVKRLAPG